ncbi:MAG: endospore germination permease [Clostridiaceae bacterium]|nr:endospore germination permease [Clostridiaceae bacterium]
MKTEMSYKITSKQFLFTFISCMLGAGVLSLPRVTAEIIAQDAWMAVILGGIIPLASILLSNSVISKYPGLSFAALTEKLGGKFLGRLMAAAFVIYSVMASAVVLRVFTEIVTMFLLPNTPTLIKIMLGLAASAYMASSGIKVLGRVNEFLFYVLTPALLLSIPAVINHGDIHYLMPVLNNTVKDYSKAALVTAFAYSGFETLIVLGPYVVKKEETLKASILALLVTMLIYLYAVITTVAVFGAELAKIYTWPSLRLLSVMEIPVLERIEFIAIIAWIGVVIKPVANQYFCASLIIKDVFGIGSLGKVVALLYPVIAYIAWYPKNIGMVFRLAEFLGKYSLILGTVLPLTLLGLSAIRGKGRAGDESNT